MIYIQNQFVCFHYCFFFRSPALIGCFIVDREYFQEIGLLDEGMEIYGGENVELGIRVRNHQNKQILLIYLIYVSITNNKNKVFILKKRSDF